MFEDRTEKTILEEMLVSITENVDTRQGSIIYDALAPCAIRLAEAYASLDLVLQAAFTDTAPEEFLERKAFDFGIFRVEAVPAKRQVSFTGTVPTVGSRFQDGTNYWELVSATTVECETAGPEGNLPPIGTNLIPVEDTPGLTQAVLREVIISGAPKESISSLRTRLLEKMQNPQRDSNKSQIKAWCKSVEGVGDAKIFPLWNGPNTVKGVLIGNDKKPLSSLLLQNVQDFIDPADDQGRHGLGEGQASIGVVFTAVAATPKTINISVHVDLQPGGTLDLAKGEIQTLVEKYLQEIAFVENQVKYTRIGSIILEASTVVDYNSLQINGVSENVVIGDEEVPVIGEVVLI